MSLEKLDEITEQVRQRKLQTKQQVYFCAGAGCISSGSLDALAEVKKLLQAKGMEKEVELIPVGCMGACNQGPVVITEPKEAMYEFVTTAKASDLVEKHLVKQEIDPAMVIFAGTGVKATSKIEEIPFFARQKKIVLENCGRIDPESIEEAIAAGAYRSLHKSLTTLSREEVIAEIKHSGLRGRGGAGFPTGLKWEMVYKYVNETKYVICNGDEGDPGAFMDRSVLEGDPHRILEGMAIAAYAVGAKKGFLYVRAEYPLAIKRLEIAIRQCKRLGLLGANIMNTGFDFDVEIRVGAGAFVCGEETALIASIEGKRGVPKPRPPYPAEVGLWGYPTLINNVETFANIAPIIKNGGEWLTEIGTQKSPGTKVFALAGKVNNTGLIEVPMGTSLKEIIFDIGGGIPGGKKFKAAQTGGPSGGCIPTEHLDTRVDYESLVSLGSIMGSGGLIVMDETSCMVDVARYFMEFCMDESCGKCIPCRVGTKQMYDILTKICSGQGSMRDLELLEELAPYVKESSLCALGGSAPNPLLSTLRYFRSEYIAHIQEKRCPAGSTRCMEALHQEVK